MKNNLKQVNSSRVLQYAFGIALALSLAACNTAPVSTANNPYLKGIKPWISSVNASSVSSITSGFLSDQTWETASNGFGPIERDYSNGESGSSENGTEVGQKISLSGVQYVKGLGVHADSSISFNLAGTCSRFKASVGLDDEVRNQFEHGNVIFRVYGGTTKLFDSGGMNRDSETLDVNVSVKGMTTLTLVVDQNKNSTEGDESNWYDHADWANARVECDDPAPTDTAPTDTTPTNPSSSAKIQFENFKAGEGIGYHDSDPVNQGGMYRTSEGVDIQKRSDADGYNIGWSAAGEWMKYDLNLEAGKYDLNMRFATLGTQKLTISIDDVEIPSSSLPDTAGFDQYLIFKVGSLDLNPGAHVVKVAYAGASPSVNLDWMEFVPSVPTSVTPQPPTTQPPTTQPPTTQPPTTQPPTTQPPSGSVVSTDFTGTDTDFPNPERGIHGYSDDLTTVSESSLANQAAQGFSLVRSYVRIDRLPNQLTSKLDNDWLAQLEQGFGKLRNAGLKTILRFSYNFPVNDNYANSPDAPLDIVLQHIKQIKPILARNADVVAFWQAGFVGAWGEWHDSSNGLDSPENKIIIRDALLDAVPEGRFLQMRYPIDLQKWNSNVPTQADAFTNNARFGIYNDCFMASDSDVGTFEGGLNDPLREYAKAVSRVAPFGVETCGVNGKERMSCSEILTEGREYSLTYLNYYYDQRFIDAWKVQGCYSEVSRSVGYRFRLSSATHQTTATRGNGWSLQFNVSNDGWSRLFNPRALKVVLRNKNTGQTIEQGINQIDPRRWLPGSDNTVSISFTIPNQTNSGQYDVLIGLPDAAPSLANDARYAIRFANSDDNSRNQAWEPKTGLFRIGTTLTVN